MGFEIVDRRLYDAVTARCVDLDAVECLLKEGGNPLAIIDYDYILDSTITNFCGTIYTDEFDLDEQKKFPKVIQLYYDYGMDLSIDNCPMHKDDWDDPNPVHPLWSLPFVCHETGIEVLKIFLENKAPIEVVEKAFLYHLLLDMGFVNGDDLEEDGDLEITVIGLKEIMLVASYPYVLDNSEFLRKRIKLDKNDASYLKKFRNWNDFEYEIDESTGTCIPFGLADSTVSIFDKKSHAKVWEFQI